MLHLSQDLSECSILTGGSTLSTIGKLTVCDSSITSSGSDVECKKAEVLCKVKLNDSKVEAAAERGAKKMLLSAFDDTYANKLKHHIKSHASALHYQLILTENCINLTFQNY